MPAEITVVDQSADGAAARVSASAAIPIRYERQREQGLAVGQNRAFRLTSEPVVAVLDDDCTADRDWLRTIDATLAEHPQLAGVTGRVLPLAEDAPGLFPVSLRTSDVRRDYKRGDLPWDVGSGNNFALRREWFDRVGGCDPRLGPGSRARGGVDMDLFYRLLRAGARIRYEPGSVVFHERKTKASRMGRRIPYGRGVGACSALWLRQRDASALRVLASWLLLRSSLLSHAMAQRRWTSVQEELLVLWGTLQGIGYGFCVAGEGSESSSTGPERSTGVER